MEFLKLLYDDEATYDKVKLLLASNNTSEINGAVMLNKYLNTLKVFGIIVKKQGQKFVVYNSPYTIDLDNADKDSIVLIKKTLDMLPKSKQIQAVYDFLKNILVRVNGDFRGKVEEALSQDGDICKNLSFYYSTYEEQIKRCEKICEDNFCVEVTYNKHNNKFPKIVSGEPVEVKYDGRKIFFIVADKDKNIEIPISKILQIKQLPIVAKNRNNQYKVIYRIKGKLAKAYRPREYEETNIENDGTRIVINSGEDYDILLSRLMRYQDNCEILFPKHLREKMHNMIKSTLELYK